MTSTRSARLAGSLICYGSDDPYVPLARSQQLAEHLHAPLQVIPGGGHLNDETGFTAFPQMRDAILAARERLTGQGRR